MHRVQVVDETFHCLKGVPACVFVGFFRYGFQFHVGNGYPADVEEFFKFPDGFGVEVYGFYRSFQSVAQFFLRVFPVVLKAVQEIYIGFQMFYECFVNTGSHEEIERGYGLSAVLFVLVGLENDGCQRGVTLYRLRSAYAAVFCVETACEYVVKVVLEACGGFGRVIVEVVYVYIPHAVRTGVFHAEQVFIGIILGNF